MRRLNRTFAGADASTDVLAFPAADVASGFAFVVPQAPGTHLGDIAISVADARANSGDHLVDELRLLAVHGLLHLLGHDHHGPGEARRMTLETRRLLKLAAGRRGEAPPRVPALVPAGH